MTTSSAARTARRPAVLVPALTVFDRLRAGSRLAVMSVVLLVPGLVTAWSYERDIEGHIAAAAQERSGLDVLVPAVTAMADVVTAEGPDDIDLAALTEAVDRHRAMDLQESLDAASAAVRDSATPAGRLAAAEALSGLVAEVASDSGLVVDPEPRSSALAAALSSHVPGALVAVAALAAAEADPQAAPGERLAYQAEVRVAVAALQRAVGAPPGAGREEADRRAAAALEPATVAVAVVAAEAGSTQPDPVAVADALGRTVEPASQSLGLLLDRRVAELERTRLRSLSITAAGLAAAVYLAAAVVWRTRHDVEQIVGGVEALAMGDHSDRAVPSGSDEFGRIGRALVMTRSVLAEAQAELERQEADREAQTRVAFNRQRDAEEQVRMRAQTIISETAEIVIQELQDVVQQVAEMRSAADVIESQVSEAERVTTTVVGQARTTDEVVDTLRDSLRRVGGMAKLIAGVADQSKLLALNATIEAARAGDAGRGFGVVAGEVKGLASATGASTDQITSTVSDLERDTLAVSTAISRMSAGIRGVDETTASLRVVASQQRGVVEALDTAVDTTIERIRQMAKLHERLERRVHARVPVSQTATARAGNDVLPIRLVDMSEGGMRFTTDRRSPALFLGATIEVDLHIDGGTVPVPGSVVHHDPEGQGVSIGMRFHDLPPRAREWWQAHQRALG